MHGNKDAAVVSKYFAVDKQSILEHEKELFAEVFRPENGLVITDRQKELCNYYWGFDQIKTPEDLHRILQTIYERFKKCKH